MARVFWWLVLAGCGWLLWRGWRRRAHLPVPQRPASPAPGSAVADPAQRELMVACAHCGVHLPIHEALDDGQGRHYCCAAHRDASAPASR